MGAPSSHQREHDNVLMPKFAPENAEDVEDAEDFLVLMLSRDFLSNFNLKISQLIYLGSFSSSPTAIRSNVHQNISY